MVGLLFSNKYQNRLVLVIFCFLAFLLTGCGSIARPNIKNTDRAALPYKVDGASDPHRIEMTHRLEKQGVKFISIGQDHLISIPSQAVFRHQSPKINWHSYALLNDVVCYLNQYRKVAVNVNSFTGKCINPKRDRALTLARSRAVADYLWSQDIKSQLIFMDGLGSDKPIFAMSKCGDSSPNSRIEITFRNQNT